MRRVAATFAIGLSLLVFIALEYGDDLRPVAASHTISANAITPPAIVAPHVAAARGVSEPTEAPLEPESPWRKAPALEAAVARAMANFTGRYSVVVHEVVTGNRWSIGAEEVYHPASTIKLPIALYALEQYRAGHLNWSDTIEYTPDDYESPGGGRFEELPFGDLYPIGDLIKLALAQSNNVAANMLGRYLGWQNIRDWTATIGADLRQAPDFSPAATPLAEVGWWLYLDKLMHQDPARAVLLIQPLQETEYQGRITAGLPQGVSHLHKYGSYDESFHDTGIIYAKNTYVLVVMTQGASEDEADEAIARVSAEVYAVMNVR